ncbi:MAG: transglutaminase domain-containing protein [Gemmatimonadetes bacterium]|nr:MAG: transglutaminase domain-containing protein [Gemmatimonadota bacterium]
MRQFQSVLLILWIGFATLTVPVEAQMYHPRSVMEALDTAGENRTELEAVLNHYLNENDPLKLLAAYYLIENMGDHSYVTIALYDSTKAEVDYEVLAYPNFDSLLVELEAIETERGELNFDRKAKILDREVITAEYLIQNIDLAFQAWHEKPWARWLTFAQFCDYVLPYRGSNEPLEAWRAYFLSEFANLPDQLDNPTDPVAAAQQINNGIKSWFGFDARFYLHPTDQGLSEMQQNKLGRCEDMTNLTIYAMRANGLAVTSDYTPHWADTGNNHAWNAILLPNGNVVPFMGCEANPGEYHLNHKAAKVYRKMFAEQPQNLAFLKPEWEAVPRWLAGKNYIDVTADYTEVCDVTLTLTQPVPDSVTFAYLGVFNAGEWRAIHWGKIEPDRQVTFTDMGKNIAYIPLYYVHEELIPAGVPFILQEDNTIRPLIADTTQTATVKLISTTRRVLDRSTDGIEQTFLTPDTEYELFYWQDEWVSLGTQIATEKPLYFEAVPHGGLYWLVEKDSREEERIFTMENGKQIWW